jgi:hypothetical protein
VEKINVDCVVPCIWHVFIGGWYEPYYGYFLGYAQNKKLSVGPSTSGMHMNLREQYRYCQGKKLKTKIDLKRGVPNKHMGGPMVVVF